MPYAAALLKWHAPTTMHSPSEVAEGAVVGGGAASGVAVGAGGAASGVAVGTGRAVGTGAGAGACCSGLEGVDVVAPFSSAKVVAGK